MIDSQGIPFRDGTGLLDQFRHELKSSVKVRDGGEREGGMLLFAAPASTCANPNAFENEKEPGQASNRPAA